MKHIVCLMGGYRPTYGPGVSCIGNLLDILEKEHKVTVITLNTEGKYSQHDVYSLQKIIRIYPLSLKLIDDCTRDYRTASGKKRIFDTLKYFFIKSFIRLLEVFSPYSRKIGYTTEFQKALDSLDEPVDMIISCHSIFDPFFAAEKYQKKHPDVILLPYLLDLYSNNDFLFFCTLEKKLKFSGNLRKERNMMRKSRKILYLPQWESHLNRYFSEFKSKFEAVEHPLLLPGKSDEAGKLNSGQDITILYSGSLIKKYRTVDYPIECIYEVLKDMSHIKLNFYSWGETAPVKQKAAELPDRIFLHAPVGLDEINEITKKSSILLSLGNNILPQVPSKIFSYFATGKPIIHFYYSERDPALPLLKKYPNCCLLARDPLKMTENIASLKAFLSKDITNISFDVLANIYADAIPEATTQKITEILNNQTTQQEV